MCKKLNFVYMIDRMKYQYFDFASISRKGEKILCFDVDVERTCKGKGERGEQSFVDGKFYNHALYQLFRNFPLA